MMLTREQAAATWCPMVRLDRDDSNAHCIADQCAMWRWGEYKTVSLAGKVIDEPALGPGGKRLHFTADKEPHRGYCGLAGPVMASAA